MTNLSNVENRLYIKGRIRIFGENEWSRRRVWMEFGRVVIRFEKGNVEDGVHQQNCKNNPKDYDSLWGFAVIRMGAPAP